MGKDGLGILRVAGRFLCRDHLRGDQLFEMVVHELHPLLPPHHDRVGDLMRLRLADEVRDRVVADHDLQGGYPAAAFRLAQQLLGTDADQDLGKSEPNLGLLVDRERIDDATDRLRSRFRVESAQHEQADFRRR